MIGDRATVERIVNRPRRPEEPFDFPTGRLVEAGLPDDSLSELGKSDCSLVAGRRRMRRIGFDLLTGEDEELCLSVPSDFSAAIFSASSGRIGRLPTSGRVADELPNILFGAG